MLTGLSVPLFDAHVHLMPERLMEAVRRYFRAHLWHPWHEYVGPTESLVPQLLAAGVDYFACSAYAHRGGMAESLNHWIANVQTTFSPHAIAFATFHPDDGSDLARLADEAFGRLGLRGVKLHPQVGRFHLDDPRLFPLYERLIERRLPLLVHAGRRPEPNEFVGAAAFGSLMRRFPDLVAIVAHMGADEFDRFFDLCDRYQDVYLDTCMVFNQHLGGPPPLGRVIEHQDRVLYGSDFPNIPYRVESAIQAITDLHLGRAMEEKLFFTNAARAIGVPGR